MTHQILFTVSHSLYNNELGEAAGVAIGKALATNTSLQTLL